MLHTNQNNDDDGDDDEPGSRHDGHVTSSQRALLRDAKAFELSARKALGGHGCFFEWLLLETLHELIRETSDAVSQSQLVERTGLTKTVVSYWMFSMQERGLVDRGPALDGRSYRIWISRDGEQTLLEYARRLGAAGLVEADTDRELFERLA
jgi:DNA-binding MarR family transcriptional regulator